jgi:hypothetical protein
MEIQIVGGSYQGRSKDINSQRCVNLFPYPDATGKKIISLHQTPGLKTWWDFSDTIPLRGAHTFNDKLFVVAGNTLWELSKTSGSLSATSRGTIGTNAGYVWMEDDRTNLMVVDGSEGYVLQSDNTFAAIADTDFPIPSSLTYQDGYFLITKDGSDQVWQSDSLDPLNWDATNFKVAAAKPDKALAAFSNLNNLFVFGEISTEVWYNSGDADFPFDLVPGAVYEFGTAAAASPAISNNRELFVLGNDLQVRRILGLQPEIVTPPQVVFQFSTYSTVSDAIGFCFNMEGQNFYCLTFPKAERTWLYNQASGFWNEWNSFPNYDRHRSNCYVHFDNKHLVGDRGNGKIYELDLGTVTDDGEEIIAYRTVQAVTAERKNIFFNTLEIELETGDEPIYEGERLTACTNWTKAGEWICSGENLSHPGAT